MRLELFMADDIQVLDSKKPILFGFYSDRVLLIQIPKGISPSPDKPAGVQALTLMATLLDLPPGEHKASIDVHGLDGNSAISSVPVHNFTSEPGKSTNIILKIAPFAASAPGVFKVFVAVDDQKLESSFEVRFVEVADS